MGRKKPDITDQMHDIALDRSQVAKELGAFGGIAESIEDYIELGAVLGHLVPIRFNRGENPLTEMMRFIPKKTLRLGGRFSINGDLLLIVNYTWDVGGWYWCEVRDITPTETIGM